MITTCIAFMAFTCPIPWPKMKELLLNSLHSALPSQMLTTVGKPCSPWYICKCLGMGGMGKCQDALRFLPTLPTSKKEGKDMGIQGQPGSACDFDLVLPKCSTRKLLLKRSMLFKSLLLPKGINFTSQLQNISKQSVVWNNTLLTTCWGSLNCDPLCSLATVPLPGAIANALSLNRPWATVVKVTYLSIDLTSKFHLRLDPTSPKTFFTPSCKAVLSSAQLWPPNTPNTNTNHVSRYLSQSVIPSICGNVNVHGTVGVGFSCHGRYNLSGICSSGQSR